MYNFNEENTDITDIEDIYNIENNKIKPNYLYLSKKLDIDESKYNKYEFRKTCIFMEQFKENIISDDKNYKYLLLNKIIKDDLLNKDTNLTGGFKNYYNKYIKYKTKYKQLKQLIYDIH